MLRTAARRLVARSFGPAFQRPVVPLRFFCQTANNNDSSSGSSRPAQTDKSEVYEDKISMNEVTEDGTEIVSDVEDDGEDCEIEEQAAEVDETEEWDVPGSVDAEGYFNEAPSFNPEPKMTRTSMAAYQLWECCAEEGMDLRVLAEMFNRLHLTLKTDSVAETVFERQFDPEETPEEDLKRTTALTAEQLKRCYRYQEEFLIAKLAPRMFGDLAPLAIHREFEVFVRTFMGMVKTGKMKYLKQFSQEFTRFNFEGFNEIPVKVVTAFKLSESQQALVTEWLELKNVLNATPVPTFRVNPKIMGGLHIVWDDKVEVMASVAPWFERGLNNIKNGFDNSSRIENNVFIQ